MASLLAIQAWIRDIIRIPESRRSTLKFGLWLSLVERLVRDQEAVGSNPTSPIYLPIQSRHSHRQPVGSEGSLCKFYFQGSSASFIEQGIAGKKRIEIGRASCLDQQSRNAKDLNMGSLKKRRKAKISKHKRRKRMRANRHKKRLRYKA